MAHLLITFASWHGQVAKIAERMARDIEADGHRVTMVALDKKHEAVNPADFDGWIMAAAVHAGTYAKPVQKFAASHHTDFAGKPTAFVSVSLSMAPGSSEKDRKEVISIADRFVRGAGWQPDAVEHVAGALLYRRYNFFLRFFMKQLMKREHHETDTSRNHEYTDWAAVDKFAHAFANRLGKAAA